MKLTVRYFAVLRERRGLETEVIEMPQMTARELADHLSHAHGLDLPASLIRIAVDGAFVDDSVALHDGQTVVLIPPVAGG